MIIYLLFELLPFDGTSCCWWHGFPGKWFDWTQARLGHTAAPPARFAPGTSARQRGTGNERTAATFPASRNGGAPHCEETQTEGSDNCLAYERAATFTSAHHISFSLLSGTILRRLKGESFDVEKMKIDCVVRLGLITSNSVAKVFIFLFTDHSSCLECKSNWFNPIYWLISPTRTTFWLKIF